MTNVWKTFKNLFQLFESFNRYQKLQRKFSTKAFFDLQRLLLFLEISFSFTLCIDIRAENKNDFKFLLNAVF